MHVDWSFADAPDGTGVANGGPPPAPLPNRPPRRPLSWRLILALAVAAVTATLGAWLFTRLGWLRLQSQLATQVAYEDKRALAGDVNAVLAVQAAGQLAWRDQLAADVRLGLAAPLPAGDLRPDGSPPRLARLDPLGGDLFAATVTRDYLDPSGQTVAFDLVQRYRNMAPGAWERLAPDASAATPTSLFLGQRLSVTVPTADLPWLGPALLQADSLIVQACADWGEACSAGRRLVAAFGVAQELANPVAGEWTVGGGQKTDQNQRPAALPRIFFLSPAPPPNAISANTLAAPLLAGRPHDAATENAFSRSIAVQLLGLFAGEVTGSPRANNDYFLDALVARVEARHLGADATPRPIAPQDYVPLQMLWQAAGAGQVESGWRTDLAWRREAVDFLNSALQGQPAWVDGKLLLNLRLGLAGGASLDDWLLRGLGSWPRGLPDRWTAQTLAAFAARPVTDWNPLNGLLMACDDGVYQVRGGARKRVLPDARQTAFTTEALSEASPDGRYAVLATYATTTDSAGTPSTVTDLQIIDLARGWVIGNAGAPWYEAVPLIGWSAGSELIFAVHDPQNGETNSAQVLQLMAYQPFGGDGPHRLIPDRVDANAIGSAAWSADHSTLLLALADELPGGQFKTSLAVLQFGGNLALFRVPQVGGSPALSPDGRQVAYVHFGNPAGPSGSATTFDAGLDRIEVLDLANGAITSLAASNDLGLPQGIRHFWGPRWSADGQTLAWTAYLNDQGNYLLVGPAAGGPVRLWTNGGAGLTSGSFSPDGRYLLAGGRTDPRVPRQVWLFDQKAPGVSPPLIGAADSIVWAPSGHRLVIAGPAGVSTLDPASGDWEWLGAWQNCQLRW